MNKRYPAFTTDGEGRGLRRPATVLTTSASRAQALDTLSAALVAASFRRTRAEGRSRRFKVGSALKTIVSEVTGAELIPGMNSWGLQATVDLTAAPSQDAPGTRVRIEVHGLTNGVMAIPYTVDALRGGVAALRQDGHTAEYAPFVEAADLPPL